MLVSKLKNKEIRKDDKVYADNRPIILRNLYLIYIIKYEFGLPR